jgi:hypothetical protein
MVQQCDIDLSARQCVGLKYHQIPHVGNLQS